VSCDSLVSTSNIATNNPNTTNTIDKVGSFFLDNSYYVPSNGIGDWQTMKLNTIKILNANESKTYSFKTDKTPWVLNAGYKQISKISSEFNVYVWDLGDISGLRTGYYTQIHRTGVQCVLIEKKGTFTIEIKSSGCEWWVKIGAEN